MISTTQSNQKRAKKYVGIILSAAIWILIWQAAAMIVDESILLSSPLKVFMRLFTIWKEDGFFDTITYSFVRIVGGFLIGLILGSLLAGLSGKFKIVETFLSPLVITVKTVPVASFVVLALMWLSADKLSIFISFLMVLPIIYTNVLDGIKNTDEKMQETATVFRLTDKKRLKYITLPQIKPFLISACRISLGLAWKSGIAAEVIGIPENSIGDRLYNAKIYFDNTDLLAWTVIIVLISVLFEKLFILLLKTAFSGLERA